MNDVLEFRFCEKLVEEPEIGTNRPYLIDSLKISTTLKLIGTSEINAPYLQNGLSAAQIAEKYCISKSFILAVIHLQDSKQTRSDDLPILVIIETIVRPTGIRCEMESLCLTNQK